MPRIEVGEVVDAIELTLSTATGLVRSQSYDELTEGIADMPLLQVYPEEWGPGRTGRTHAITGGGAVRNTEWVIYADLYGRQRSSIGQDMGVLVPLIDAVEMVLEAQKVKPYFNLAGIESFNWEGRRVTFQYGSDSPQMYIGARYTITVRIF